VRSCRLGSSDLAVARRRQNGHPPDALPIARRMLPTIVAPLHAARPPRACGAPRVAVDPERDLAGRVSPASR